MGTPTTPPPSPCLYLLMVRKVSETESYIDAVKVAGDDDSLIHMNNITFVQKTKLDLSPGYQPKFPGSLVFNMTSESLDDKQAFLACYQMDQAEASTYDPNTKIRRYFFDTQIATIKKYLLQPGINAASKGMVRAGDGYYDLTVNTPNTDYTTSTQLNVSVMPMGESGYKWFAMMVPQGTTTQPYFLPYLRRNLSDAWGPFIPLKSSQPPMGDGPGAWVQSPGDGKISYRILAMKRKDSFMVDLYQISDTLLGSLESSPETHWDWYGVNPPVSFADPVWFSDFATLFLDRCPANDPKGKQLVLVWAGNNGEFNGVYVGALSLREDGCVAALPSTNVDCTSTIFLALSQSQRILKVYPFASGSADADFILLLCVGETSNLVCTAKLGNNAWCQTNNWNYSRDWRSPGYPTAAHLDPWHIGGITAIDEEFFNSF